MTNQALYEIALRLASEVGAIGVNADTARGLGDRRHSAPIESYLADVAYKSLVREHGHISLDTVRTASVECKHGRVVACLASDHRSVGKQKLGMLVVKIDIVLEPIVLLAQKLLVVFLFSKRLKLGAKRLVLCFQLIVVRKYVNEAVKGVRYSRARREEGLSHRACDRAEKIGAAERRDESRDKRQNYRNDKADDKNS